MLKNKLISVVKDSYGNEWTITASAVYESLIKNAPLFCNFDEEKYPNVISNVATQLQLLEFNDLLLSNFTFEPEGEVELPSFIGGGTAEIHNEVEHAICKQGLIATGSVAETVCFIILESNRVEVPKRCSFEKLIKLSLNNNLIDYYDAKLLDELRRLRNNLHFHIDQNKSFDIGFFHIEQYDIAKSCLYWILTKLLKIDEKVTSIHFPYLPKKNKEELHFEL